MDLVGAFQDYVTRFLAASGNGMKALMLDQETTKMMAMVYSQSVRRSRSSSARFCVR